MGSKRLRVYLSGGMEYARNEGADWRNNLGAWITEELGHSVFNPNEESAKYLRRMLPNDNLRKLKFHDMDRYLKIVRGIVSLDSREIARRTDYVVCLWDKSAQKGAGTKGEITLAKFFGKPVFLVTSHKIESIPGWVLGCVTRRFRSMSELKTFLKSEFTK